MQPATFFQRAHQILARFRHHLDFTFVCITHPLMRSILIGNVQVLVHSVLAILAFRSCEPPPGMRWQRTGLRWGLFKGATLVAYVKCNSGYDNRYVYWNAVYLPDTIECIAYGSRHEAQSELASFLRQPRNQPIFIGLHRTAAHLLAPIAA